MSQREAAVSAWHTTLLKTLPLALLIIMVLATPALGYINEETVNKSLKLGVYVFVMFAFLVELGYSLPEMGHKGHFGTPLLAGFAIASLLLGLNSWFGFYNLGSSAQIDAFVYIFFVSAIMLLFWQARSEYFKHNRLKLKIFQKFSR